MTTKHLLLLVLAILIVCSFVGVVFANPLPMDSLWEGKPIQYMSIVVAEFCGLLAGVSVLTYKDETRWQRAAAFVLMALVVSYGIGVTIWTLAQAAGILIYNPINPFLNYATYPLGLIVLLLPEFIGTAIGTGLIHVNGGIRWKPAFLAMAAAMFTSSLVEIWIANIYLRAM